MNATTSISLSELRPSGEPFRRHDVQAFAHGKNPPVTLDGLLSFARDRPGDLACYVSIAASCLAGTGVAATGAVWFPHVGMKVGFGVLATLTTTLAAIQLYDLHRDVQAHMADDMAQP